MPRQGNDSASREAVVACFDRAAKIFEVFCPKGVIRLPSPRGAEAKVMVEVDLASFDRIMDEMKNPARTMGSHLLGVEPPSTRKSYPNLRSMLERGRFYSFDSAQAELRAVIDFVDGKR